MCITVIVRKTIVNRKYRYILNQNPDVITSVHLSYKLIHMVHIIYLTDHDAETNCK